MSYKIIPPTNKRSKTIEEIKSSIKFALESFVESARLNDAAEAVFNQIELQINLPTDPTKGATVATEGSALGHVKPKVL